MSKFELVRNEFRKYPGEEIMIPSRGSVASAGYDFYLPCYLDIPPRTSTSIISTDIKVKLADDEVLLLFIRSSVGIKKGVVLSNGTGIIDADYYNNPDNDGNIGIALYNPTDHHVTFNKYDRVMQGIIIKYSTVEDDEPRGTRKGGFGSTGK